MPTVFAFTPKYQLLTDNHDLAVGWKVHTYEAGTSTPLASYVDSTGTAANANPVITDARGEIDLWLDINKLYKIVLKDENDVSIWSVDYFGAIPAITGSVTVDSTAFPQWCQWAISNQTDVITTGTKFTMRMPACTIVSVRASLKTASSSGIPTFDINEGGVSILSTLLTIDANETTSTTAATPVVISDATIANDSEITFDIDVAGTGAVGPIITMLVRWT